MRYKTYLLSIVISIVLSNSFIIDYLLNHLGVPFDLLFSARIVSAILLVPLSRVLLAKISALLKEYTFHRNTAIVVLAFFLALFFQFTIPINTSQNSMIEITANGSKESSSLGTEVWIKGIEIDGRRIPFDKFLYDHNAWEEKNDSLVSYKNQPATVQWKGEANEKIELYMIQHPYSGEVNININGTISTCSLYAPEGLSKSISININDGKWQSKSVWLKFLANVIIMWLIIILAILKLIKNNGILPISYIPANKPLRIFLHILPFALVWGFYVLVFYPGIMSPDSVDQWKQANGAKVLTTAHPVFHTLFNWAITRVWLSPTAIAVVQVTFMASVVGYALESLSDFGVTKVRLRVLTLFFLGMPIFGILGNSLWKDIPYSVSLLWLTILLTKIYVTEAKFISGKGNQLILSFVLLLVSQFRHEGIFAAILTIVCLMLAYKNRRKEVLRVLLGCLLFCGLFKVSATLAFHPQPPPIIFQAMQIVVQPMNHIAAGLKEGWVPSSDDKSIIEGIMPLAVWIDNYDKYNVERLVYSPFLDPYFLKDNQINLLKVWMHLFINRPESILHSWANLNSLCWQIRQPTDGYQSVTLREQDYMSFYKEVYGNVTLSSFLPNVKSAIIKFHFWSNNFTYSWFLWRPALYFYLSWFMFIGLIFNKKWKAILPIVPITTQVIVMMLLIPVQDVRYLFSVFLVCPFLIMFTTCFQRKL
ncbi:hypothetical protein PIPA1_40510 [Pelosinus sp. IPA-1]|nr:hypothetical protein PIPA1_40510 [Pelosinus sp. IPA-1]